MMTYAANSKACGNTIANTVLMVPPVGFCFNAETAATNKYQKNVKEEQASVKAIREFNAMVKSLKDQDIDVLIYHANEQLPDAVFPNNWFSTHVNLEGKTDLFIYPMLTPSRQAEVTPEALTVFLKKHAVQIGEIIDLRNNTQSVLEGTGSMILDRQNHIIYAALSARTDIALLEKVAKKLRYKTVSFIATDNHNQPIYHTNVMMGLTQHFAVVCLECILDEKERKEVIKSIETSGRTIIDINQNQVNHMCGNVLELQNKRGEPYLVMSEQAYSHYKPEQKALLAQYNTLLVVNIPTIEILGGGSARCMLAEIYKSES